MNKLNTVLTELGVSKVRLAKYLGVSRQMLYNYLALDNLEDWPKEKAVKLLGLLNIKGDNLRINKLSIDTSEVVVEGDIYSMVYSEKDLNKKGTSLIGKIFK